MLFFLFFSSLSIMCIIFKSENLFLVAKTCVFPSILFYYLERTIKINKIFLIVLIIFYSVDLLLILQINNLIFYLAILLNINHLIILVYSIQNIEKIKINVSHFLFTIFLFLIGCLIQYLIFISIVTTDEKSAMMIFISGMLVVVFSSIAFYNYSIRSNYKNFYFGFACLSIGFMYAFYDIYKYIFYSDILKILSLICNVLSYYFFIKFFLADERIQQKLTMLKAKKPR